MEMHLNKKFPGLGFDFFFLGEGNNFIQETVMKRFD